MMIKYADQTNNCKTVTKYSASQGKPGGGNKRNWELTPIVIYMDSKMGWYVNFSNFTKFNRSQKCTPIMRWCVQMMQRNRVYLQDRTSL
jgi:hypothetical protein